MSSSSAPLPRKILCYRKLKDATEWFIYWLTDENIFGITNGQKKVYEKKMTKDDRKKLLGNVAESLISSRWSNLFDNRAFDIEFNDDYVEISYVTRSITLDHVTDEEVRHQRVSGLISIFIEQYSVISKKLQEIEKQKQIEALNSGAKRRQQFGFHGKSKIPPKNRRTLAKPTGLQFNDDDDEEEEEQEVNENPESP